MSADLERAGNGVSFGFAGDRKAIWHGEGTALAGLMTLDEALDVAHMDRHIRIVKVDAPARWAVTEQYLIILEGKVVDDPDGPFVIEDKVVGFGGKGAADAHASFSMRDRLELAEFTLRASAGEAVWSTAGMLADGRQGFACMEAPATVIDPKGINDVIQNFATVAWSFDGSRQTELGASNVRVVCANTLAAHDFDKIPIIKVKHTSDTVKDRMEQAAKHWALAQDRAKALEVLANRLLAVQGRKMAIVDKVIDGVLGKRPADKGRSQTLWDNKRETIEILSAAPTNNVGDNGWAAFNTITEYLDWFAPIKCDGQEEVVCRWQDQFDGKSDNVKAKTAERILALAN